MGKIGKALNSSKLGGKIIGISSDGIIIKSSNEAIIYLSFPEGISVQKKNSFDLLKIGQFIHTQCKIGSESINGHHKIYVHRYEIAEDEILKKIDKD